MKSVPKISRWQEGEVNRRKEHFELRYGSFEDSAGDEWIPVALVSPPVAGVVKVQFLVKPDCPGNADVVRAVAQEIQYYLIDLGEPKPWTYAKYHCGTCANAYSKVHWSYREPAGKRTALAGKRPEPGKKAARIPGKS